MYFLLCVCPAWQGSGFTVTRVDLARQPFRENLAGNHGIAGQPPHSRQLLMHVEEPSSDK